MTTETDTRLEYLRGQIRAESISYGEIAELQGLAEHIDPSDVELLQWAGVPEFPPQNRYEWSAYVWVYASSEDEARAAVRDWQNAASKGDVTVSVAESPPIIEEDEAA